MSQIKENVIDSLPAAGRAETASAYLAPAIGWWLVAGLILVSVSVPAARAESLEKPLPPLVSVSSDTTEVGTTTLRVQSIGPMTRVGPVEAILGGDSVTIRCGRNEWESFQVVVSAEGDDLVGVDAVLSPFVGPGGALLDSIRLYREHFVEVTTPSPFSPLPPQFHPDALIPFDHPETGAALAGSRFDAVPFTLLAGHNQPLWVEVYVPSDAQPGSYQATLEITAVGHNAVSIPVDLQVWSFVLPETSSLQSSFWMSDYQMDDYYDLNWQTQPHLLYPITRRYYDLVLEHRLTPTRPVDVNPAVDPTTGQALYGLPYPGLGTAEVNLTRYMDDRRATASNFPLRTFWPFSDPLGVDRVKAQQFTASVLDLFASHGWDDRLVAYLVALDEPASQSEYQELRDWGEFLDEVEITTGLALPMLVTAHPTPPVSGWGTLVGAADIWVPCCDSVWRSEEYYGLGVIADRLAAGDRVWWYTALTGASPEWWISHGNPTVIAGDNAPIWEIDFPPLNYRIAPWFAVHYGFSGLLYWQVANWTADPWTDPANFTASGFTYNGDGMLIYPGRTDEIGFDGAVPSMRLKWLRQGMEEYEYFRLLIDLGEEEFALARLHEAARNMGDWEEDPAAWEAARIAIGDLLDSLFDQIFFDGFESGDTTAWSASSP